MYTESSEDWSLLVFQLQIIWTESKPKRIVLIYLNLLINISRVIYVFSVFIPVIE